MKRTRTSAGLALAAQAAFGISLFFFPWMAAALVGLGIALLAMTIRLSAGRGPFPRLEMGSLLMFLAMATACLFAKGESLLPYTGVFFAAGLGCACIADLAFDFIEAKAMRTAQLPSTFFGIGYLAAAYLQLAFFPHLEYLLFGVGLLTLVSLADIGHGILQSILKHSRRAKAAGAVAACLLLFSLAPIASAEEAQSADDALYADLFDDVPPQESPDDLLRIADIKINRPDGFSDAYLLSYAREIRKGSVIKRAALDGLLKRVNERLELSGMFYQSSASYVAAESSAPGANDVVVILKASEGFWWGFNFQPWDLSLSYGNLFNDGKQAALVLGLNTQGLAYADPAIRDGPFFFALGAAHDIALRGSGADPSYLCQRIQAFGEIGVKAADDASFAIDSGYIASRTLPSYFPYREYAASSPEALASLGMKDGFASVASLRADARLGYFSYKKRGGLKARADLSSLGYFPLATVSPLAELSFAGDLRFDAPKLISMGLHQTLQYFPQTLGGTGLPEFLWAYPSAYRGGDGLPSGEFASLSRLSLAFDSGKRLSLGFTRLALMPELYYEVAVTSRASYSPSPVLAQDFGALLRAEFSAPVGRSFIFGVAATPMLSAGWKFTFVFEVE
jgi:hypothetical protein